MSKVIKIIKTLKKPIKPKKNGKIDVKLNVELLTYNKPI